MYAPSLFGTLVAFYSHRERTNLPNCPSISKFIVSSASKGR
uniref:Uncharacterized protein n=1 Tax=Arundo donax TaxID=35708 RepID=A0A0A8ZKG5_ARUDO